MYFSQVRIDPNDPDVVDVRRGRSSHVHRWWQDGQHRRCVEIHSDHHAIWLNPANSNHILIGNDGGLAVSWDQAKTWNFLPNLPVGLFYHVSVDMATPYNICGGMQDNYSWCGPSAVRGTAGIAGFTWQTMQGGDGFVAIQDPTEFRIAYSESQDGNMVRIDRVTGETISIRPQAERRRAADSLELGHAARDVAARSEDHLRRRQQGVPFVQPRAELGDGRHRPHEQRQPRRHRDDGREGQRYPHLEERRHPGLAHHHLVRGVGEAHRHHLRGHRRRHRAGVARQWPDRGPTSPTRFPGCRRASGCRRSCRRGSTRGPSMRRSMAIG